MAWSDFAGIYLLQTKAYEYFQRAADMKQDDDSLFNTGHCLAPGTGTKQDYRRYVHFYFKEGYRQWVTLLQKKGAVMIQQLG